MIQKYPMEKQIAVLSTGAIGSSIGADLAHAGCNVSLTALEKLMKHAGKITITDNIEGAKWTKLVKDAGLKVHAE